MKYALLALLFIAPVFAQEPTALSQALSTDKCNTAANAIQSCWGLYWSESSAQCTAGTSTGCWSSFTISRMIAPAGTSNCPTPTASTYTVLVTGVTNEYYVDQGLSGGTIYCYSVQAVDATGSSTYSTTAGGPAYAGPFQGLLPAAPGGVTAVQQ